MLWDCGVPGTVQIGRLSRKVYKDAVAATEKVLIVKGLMDVAEKMDDELRKISFGTCLMIQEFVSAIPWQRPCVRKMAENR